LGARTATVRGRRRGAIAFGDPLALTGHGTRDDARRLGDDLRQRVQAAVDGLK
jgi:hypothetical protein